jgi:hypothetical protein
MVLVTGMSPYRDLYGRECTQVNTIVGGGVLEENMNLKVSAELGGLSVRTVQNI